MADRAATRGLTIALRREAVRLCIAACSAMLPCGSARALHYDVALRLVHTGSATVIETDLHGDLRPEGGLPLDAATGQQIFPGYFGDLEGGPQTTDDPGFQAFKGTFAQGEVIQYRALGRLEYWDPITRRWGLAPPGAQLILYGGIPPEVALGHAQDPARWAAQHAFHAGGTRFHRDGIEGPVTAFIDDARKDGSFHAHLDWRIATTLKGGLPAAGAYLVTLKLWSSTTLGGVPKYEASRPIKVLFEHGISQDQWADALRARVKPSADAQGEDATAQIPRPPWAMPSD